MSFSARIALLALAVGVTLTYQAQAVEATDNFDRANGSLGGSWSTNVDAGGSLQIVSNRVQPAKGTYGESLYTISSFGGPQFSEIQLTSGLAGGVINLVVRGRQYTGGNFSDSYRGQLNGLSGQWRIIRVDNNIETVLASGALSYANGDTFAFIANGAVLTLNRNGAMLGSANDALYGTGAPGLGIYNRVSLLVDNWRGGDDATADSTPPSAPGTPAATATSTSQINLSWSAAADDVGVAGYRVERCQGVGCTTFGEIAAPTTTSFSDVGLTSSTTYQYRVRATDAAGNLSAYSTVGFATTLAPASVTVTDNFNRANGGLGSGWTQNMISTSALLITSNQVQTPVGKYSESIYTGSAFSANHFAEVQYVSGLSAGVINLAVRAQQYTVAGQGDGYLGQLNGLTGMWRILRVDNSVETTLASGALSYAANDVFTFAASGTTLTLSRNGSTLGSATSFTYGAGAPGLGAYSRATLLVDNWHSGDTSASTDTAPPSVPASVSAATVTASQIDLTWTASTDNVAVTGYKIERCQGMACTNFSQVAMATGTTYGDLGLAAGTTYRYQVRAFDAAGNDSEYSAVVTCTTSVTGNCTTSSQFTVGGTLSGLASGASVVLRNNSNNLAVSANGTFIFTTPVASGAPYAVTVLTQPSSPTQTCVVINGAGTMASGNITDVTVTCTTSEFTVGGTISGLTTSGLDLRNNGGTALAISAGATSFTFPTTVASGTAYAVTVSQQPSPQNCTVSGGTGTVTNANVTNVSIVCGSGSSGYTFITNRTGTPRVASYSVGANGGFTQVSALSVGAPATGVAATSSGNHVIVAVDPSNSADGSLRVYSVSSTGELAFVSSVPMGPGVGGYSHTAGCGNWNLVSGALSCGLRVNSAPETVLIHPNGRFVYVMDGVAGGACNPPGVAPCTPQNGGTPAAGNRVIVRYTFDPATGTLTYHDRHYVEGFMSFAMDPQGRFVWGTSYLERRIYEFRIDQSTGALSFGTGTYIGMSNGSMWLGIDPSGRYAYAAHVGDRTIDSYTIDQTTGHLTNIGAASNGSCGAPANCNKVTNVTISSLAVSADGRTLYGASSSGNGSVAAYALGSDGRIGAKLPGSPFAPSTPLNGGSGRAKIGIGPEGQYLYLLGYTDSAARVFAINSSTGALTETSASPTALVGGSSGITALFVQ